MIGKKISHYKILEKLGGGGMGVVYKARDLKLDRSVALKFLPPHLSTDDDGKQRFIQEAKAASALDHPNICTIHEIDETKPAPGEPGDGRLFIVMAYYQGQTLKQKLANVGAKDLSPVSIDQALNIAIQIAQGLSKAHQKGIVHRDIKPANIMITDDGMVKILDFGIAKLAGTTRVTREGTTKGTVSYMSPEQIRGKDVNQCADIWSLGVVLYEMLCGEQPFKGDIDQAVIYSILNEEPESISLLQPNITSELSQTIEKALAKSLSERYQTIEKMLDDLKCLTDSSGASVTRIIPRRLQQSRKKHVFLLAIAVLLLFVLFMVIFLWLPIRQTTDAKKSIAVLPFKNFSQEPENEYFCDGITEDIITQLSKIEALRVISHTSVLFYKDRAKNLREIAKELKVETILEGSVRRAGEQIRVVAQLVDASRDEHIWAETYNRELRDVFEIQSDVSEKIASALQVKMSPEEKKLIEKLPTRHLDAYVYELRGRDYLQRHRKEDNEYAIRLFKKSLEIDSNFTRAWVNLGTAYAQRSMKYGFSEVWYDSSILASQNALAIDPDYQAAYTNLGLAYLGKGWFQKTIEVNKKVLSKNPDHPYAVDNTGWAHYYSGNHSEAFKYFKKAETLKQKDKFLPISGMGSIYREIGDFEKAESLINKAIDFSPDMLFLKYDLIYVYIAKQEYKKAISLCEQSLPSAPNDNGLLSLLGAAEILSGNHTKAVLYYKKLDDIPIEVDTYGPITPHWSAYLYRKIGERERADELSKKYLKKYTQEIEEGDEDWRFPYMIASIYTSQGDKKLAYEWLKKALEAGWKDYHIASIDPMFENLRAEDRFQQIINQLKNECIEIRKQIRELEEAEL